MIAAQKVEKGIYNSCSLLCMFAVQKSCIHASAAVAMFVEMMVDSCVCGYLCMFITALRLQHLGAFILTLFDYSVAVPTSNTTPASSNITAISMSVIGLLLVISILLGGVSIVLCLLYKRRTQNTTRTVLAETANASVENQLDPIYEDIDDIFGMDHLVATSNLAYGVTGIDSFSQVPVTENVAYGVTGVSDGFLDVSATGNVAVEISAELMAVLKSLQLRDAPYEANGVDGSSDVIAAANVDYDITGVHGSSEMSATGNIVTEVDSTSDVNEKSIT